MTRSTLPDRRTPPAGHEVAGLRRMLEEQRAFRLEQLAQLYHPDPHRPLSSTDPEVLRSLVEGARAALRDVQSALWRIEDGSYGACASCGNPLEVERLEILPQAALCMPCQQSGRPGQSG
jgi:RNA polymerase-binding transcription factor